MEAVLPSANVWCTPRVVVYVLSVKTPGAKSLGSATDANVTSEENGQGILQASTTYIGHVPSEIFQPVIPQGFERE